MFARQRVLMAIHGQPVSHDPFQTTTETRFNDLLPIKSFKEARERLYDCLNDTVLLLQAARTAEVEQLEKEKYHTLCSDQDSLLGKLKLWYNDCVQHWFTDQEGFTTRERSIAQIMTMKCEIAFVWVRTCLQPEIALDQYMHCFERILNLAEEVIQRRHESGLSSVKFSPEMGLVAPLFLTGWKCRDPYLRRKAMDLLYRGPEQEALYSANVHAKALKAVIDIEEGNAMDSFDHQKLSEGLPPEEARLRNLTIHYETFDGVKVKTSLVYGRRYQQSDGKSIFVEKSTPL
ncbi:MAG: hypothetical protein Q9227_007890 [Pyrenula ochraceoflavens]